jgi:hypothetical protein
VSIDPRTATAYHEAAHTVVAYLSEYHSPYGVMRLLTSETGDTQVSLSKEKLRRAGKVVEQGVEQDPQVRMEFALIQLAGLGFV